MSLFRRGREWKKKEKKKRGKYYVIFLEKNNCADKKNKKKIIVLFINLLKYYLFKIVNKFNLNKDKYWYMKFVFLYLDKKIK